MLKQTVLSVLSLAGGTLFGRGSLMAPRDDNTLLLQQLLDSARPGSTVRLPGTSFRISRTLWVRVGPLRIEGHGAEITQSSLGEGGLAIRATDVTVRDLTLKGPSVSSGGIGVECVGRTDSFLDGVQLANVTLRHWAYAIRARFCESATVVGNTISDVSYAGIMFESSRNCSIGRNTIRRITGRPNAYGIAVTRASGSVTEHPLSTGFVVFDNRISDVPYWEAVDTHGGRDIEIRDNDISNVRIGIMITYSDEFAPQRCRAHHNIVRAGSASPQTGAEIVGLPTQQAEDCAIESNSIDGFGTTGGVDGGSVRVQYATRPRVVANRITNSLQSALVLFGEVVEADVSHNTILGIDARAGAFIAAIKVPHGRVTGRIVDNHIEAGIAAGIRVQAKQRILVENNYIETTGRPYHPDLSYFVAR
jgi:parallel beta-helix repeat protein